MDPIDTPPAGKDDLAEKELRAVLDAAVDGVLIIDHLGRIEACNRAAEKMLGYAAHEVLGQNVSMMMPEPYRSEHDRYLAHHMATGETRIIGKGREVVARRRDGSLMPIALSVGRIENKDRPRFVGFLHDITDRRRAMEALRRERDRAQSYLDLAEVMLVALDSDGNITLINRKGCEILGWAEDDLVGRNWFDTCVPGRLRADARAMFDLCMKGNAELIPYNEFPIATRNGGTKLIAWRDTFLRDERGLVSGMLSSGEDVTEQRRATEALRKSEQLLQDAQELANLGNYELRMPGGTPYWSPQMRRILGAAPTGPVPDVLTFINNCVHEDDRDRFLREWDEVAPQGGRLDIEHRILRPDGTVRDVHTLAEVRRGPGGALTVVGTLHDITERRQADEEARQAQDRLTQFARLSTMGEMAAGLAHEINQPLTAITTYAHAVLRLMNRPDADPEDIRQALEQIAGQALRAGEVIKRLRAFVKNRETRQEVLPPGRLIEESLHFAESDARINDVRLLVEVEDDLPLVCCDPVQLQQVLINLIRNAIDATHETAPERREVSLRARLDPDGHVEISVEDRGPGISEEVAAHLGDPFFTTKTAGTGLGLAISRSILRAHGGKLGHRPTHPAGATVFFTLPVLPGSQQ